MSARRLVELLGSWREPDSRHPSADLAGGIRLLAQEGRLPAGTRLPAERELAEALTVSRTLVTKAVNELREDGVVASRQGSGTWITAQDRPWGVEPAQDAGLIDLGRASSEAVPEMMAAVDAAVRRLPALLGGHGYQPQGLPELREAIAARYRSRGLATTADQIIVTAGAHHAFVLILRLLVHPGDRVLVEQPTYPNALDAIRASYARPVGVAMTDDGWCLDGIDAALRQSSPRLAYFVPDFHNPTGHRMDAGARAQLATALRRTRTMAVADETLVELDLDGDPLLGPPPLAGFAEDYVITVGSASKSHWGGLRIGWVRAPAELVERIVSIRSAVDLGAPVFEQLVLTELLADPDVLPRRRAVLAHRRDVLLEALAEHCPTWTIRRPAGGQSAWCELDEPVATRLAVAAESHGLRLVPGARFGVDGGGWERFVRVPYGLPPAELTDAAARLGRLYRAVGGRHTTGSVPVPVT